MTDAIISGIFLGLALIFSVGPVIFTIIKLRINYGLVNAFFFIGGVWLSDFVWVITANFFSELLVSLISFKKLIGVAGGIFLIGLGIFYLFFKKYHRPAEFQHEVKIGNATHARVFLIGFLINTLNPGVIALWFAAATKSLSDTYNERFVFFSICLLMNMGADILKIYLAGRLSKKLTGRNIGIINKISGLMFLLFGILLIVGAVWSANK